MRILHFVESTDSRLGGVAKFVLDCARVMSAKGHPSTVLTLDSTDTPVDWLGNETDPRLPRVERLLAPSVLGRLFSQPQLRSIKEDLQTADVVHLHCVWSTTTVQIGSACKAMGIPYVVSCHGMLDDWSMNQGAIKKRIFHTLSARMFLENAAHVHCTARAEFEQSGKWFERGHEYIVPYIIDLEPFKALPGPEQARQKFNLGRDGRPTVLFLSRLHEKKGIEHLLRAAATLRQDGFRGEVVIAGAGEDGYVQSLRQAAKSLNLGEQVKFVGQVKGAEKLSLYEASDLFVLPTSQENFGLVLVEALACGTPLVTTKGVDIWRDVEESGAARVVANPERELAGAMKSILGDESSRQKMAAAARPWVFKTYDQDRLAGEFAHMYRESLRGSTRGSVPRSATVMAG